MYAIISGTQTKLSTFYSEKKYFLEKYRSTCDR